MDEAAMSNWERGARKGPRPLVLLALVIVLFVGTYAVLLGWMFVSVINSPGNRVADAIYDAAPSVVNSATYAPLPVETLTIVVARDVTSDEALDLRCRLVVPMLSRENLSPRIVIKHPDDDFFFSGVGCPAP